MGKHRAEPRYKIADSVEVYVGDRKYFVFLESEIVVQEVIRKGKAILRRVTSWEIETAAILRASDKINNGGE